MKQKLHIYKARLFKALSHPLRLAILDALRDGEKTVSQLQKMTGAGQATISQHLNILRTNHFVAFRKDGTQAFYRNEDPDVYMFLDFGRQIFERQLDRQGDYIRTLQEEQQ